MVALLLLLAIEPADAADRTVCFELKIRDERSHCPLPGTLGARRPCMATTGGDFNIYSYAVGWRYELWDKNPGAPDSYIGTFLTNGTGRRCATFPWEFAPYWNGEADPDVYLKLLPQVRSAGDAVPNPGTGPIITAVTGAGTDYHTASWRDGPSGDPDKYVAVDCASGANCQILPGVAMTPTKLHTTNYSLALMAIDSAQRGLNAFNSAIDEDSDIRFFVDELLDLPDTDCTTGCAESRTEIYMPDTLAHEGDRAAHELGHVLQMREFGQDDLRDVLGSGWSLESIEFDSGATTEGWASYAGAVAWYEPETLGVFPLFQFSELETRGVPTGMTCADSSGTPLQSARVFWDLDDADDEGGDPSNHSTQWLLNRWSNFPNGLGNREDYENDDNGVNVWDYAFNAPLLFIEQSNINGNCADSQDL